MHNRMVHNGLESLGWERLSSSTIWGRCDGDITQIVTVQERRVLSPKDLLNDICRALDATNSGCSEHHDESLLDVVSSIPMSTALLLRQRNSLELANALSRCRASMVYPHEFSTNYILIRRGALPSSIVSRITSEHKEPLIDWYLGCSAWAVSLRKRELGYRWVGALPVDRSGRLLHRASSVYSVTPCPEPKGYFQRASTKHLTQFSRILDDLFSTTHHAINPDPIDNAIHPDLHMQYNAACAWISSDSQPDSSTHRLMLPYWP